LDQALDTSFSYLPLITTVSGQYWKALDKVALRHRPLTPDEKQRLADINKEIVQLQPTYDLYRDRYFDAAEAYEFEASKPVPNQARLQRLLTGMNEAWSNWESIGLKQYFEDQLLGQAWQIQTGNPDGEWTRMRSLYRFSSKIAPLGPYQTTLLSPPIGQWKNAGWATFSKTITEAETHQYSHSVSWSAGAGARWGLFNHVDVGVNGTKTVTHVSSDVTSIETTFDYLRCRIIRPWLDTNLFASKDWTWIQPNTFEYLSDGGNLSATPPTRPVGTLPMLPTHAIAVRNVTIRANFSHNDQQTMDESINGNVSAGFGCFSVRGTYAESTHTVDVRATFDGTQLLIPDPQIIGFMGSLLPKSPDPDEHLPYWPGTAVFPHQMTRKDRDAIDEVRKHDMTLSEIRRRYRATSDAIDIEAEKKKEEALKKIVKELGEDKNPESLDPNKKKPKR
jgi:hypothetical protein